MVFHVGLHLIKSLPGDDNLPFPHLDQSHLLQMLNAPVEGFHGKADLLRQLGSGLFQLQVFGLRLPLLNGLGSLTASMTSTPALAMLVELSGTDDVAAPYATTYPIALITLVLTMQVLVNL